MITRAMPAPKKTGIAVDGSLIAALWLWMRKSLS